MRSAAADYRLAACSYCFASSAEADSSTSVDHSFVVASPSDRSAACHSSAVDSLAVLASYRSSTSDSCYAFVDSVQAVAYFAFFVAVVAAVDLWADRSSASVALAVLDCCSVVVADLNNHQMDYLKLQFDSRYFASVALHKERGRRESD